MCLLFIGYLGENYIGFAEMPQRIFTDSY